MALKDTVNTMKRILSEICRDMEKANNGNKAAAQRVRTGTIKLEKVAKVYRKESVASEKKSGPKKSAKKPAAKKGVQMKRATAKIPSRKR